MADTDVIVVERDPLGRPSRVERYGAGDALPEWLDDRLQRETQASDPRGEVKANGSGWYTLPGGETVRGKDAVREAGYEVPE
jgi:hypothetical protein